MNKERPVSDEPILPHQQFDIVAKDPFYVFPEDMLQFLMNRQDFEFIEHVDSNLTTVEIRYMDILTKVRTYALRCCLDGALCPSETQHTQGTETLRNKGRTNANCVSPER